MSNDADPDALAPRITTIQIINTALVGGVLVFLGISLYLRSQHPDGVFGPAAPDANRALPVFAVILSVGNTLAAYWLPKTIVESQRRALAEGRETESDDDAAASDTTRLLSVYTTTRIVQIALLEGAAFLCLIVYYLQGHPEMLVLAMLLVAGMVVGWPSRSRLETWLSQQTAQLDRERARARR